MSRASVYRPRSSWYKNFASGLRARRGGQRYLLATLYGAICALAFSPTDIVPVLWVSFPALIFLLQGTENWKSAFATGWCFAFGFFVPDLYWTAASMFVDLYHFWWAVPLALFGLPAFFAIYYGIAAALARRLGLQGLQGAIGFALLWFLADYVRGHLFTGFPWNIAGYIWADFLPVLQITSVIGIYGLTLLTLVAACLPASMADEKTAARNHRLVLGSLLAMGLLIVWGSLRLSGGGLAATVPDVRLRLVQPDVEQQLKWQPEIREDNFGRLLSLSSAARKKPVTAVIWPETASPFYLAQDEDHRRAVAAVTPKNGSIITGLLRGEEDEPGHVKFFNSLMAIDRTSRITGVYDKSHLVPFGEYMPLRQWLHIPSIAGLGIDFSHGTGPKTLHADGLPPFSPLICYEVIFPGAVVDRHDRPQLLLNVTNDGWYGRTAGPHQHFAIARVRAVEEGLPLVRAANTGISGIVDSYGRITAKLGLGKSGFIDADLPTALPQPTFFARAGEMPLWLIFGWLACGVVFGRLRRIKN